MPRLERGQILGIGYALSGGPAGVREFHEIKTAAFIFGLQSDTV